MYTRLLEPDQISYTQSMVAKRGLTNRACVHTCTCTPPYMYMYVKKPRIPIDPAILAAIGHRFIAQKKKTKKLTRGDQKPETFFGQI